MSLIERKIDVQIALNGQTFGNGNDTVTLSGLRMQAMIENFSGGLGSSGSAMHMTIWGMSGADMAKLSTLGFDKGIGYKKNLIDVFAGDDEVGMAHIFSGAIFGGSVDYNAMPDVGVQLLAHAMFNEQMTAVAGSSYKGDMDVGFMLQGLAHAAGWAFENAGVTAKLSNHAVGGSIIDQVRDICTAANIQFAVKPGSTKTLVIWPAGGSRDNTVIEVSPQKGMVGYPEYATNSVIVTSLFNPNIEFGRMVKVTSSVPNLTPQAQAALSTPAAIPGGNGVWYCWNVVHELSSQLPNGPWFTRAQLGNTSYAAR